jgi:hypothetical protein
VTSNPGVANRVVRAVETSGVAHLRPDRYRDQRPNTVVGGLQRPTYRLPTADCGDLLPTADHVRGESIDLAHADRDRGPGRWRQQSFAHPPSPVRGHHLDLQYGGAHVEQAGVHPLQPAGAFLQQVLVETDRARASNTGCGGIQDSGIRPSSSSSRSSWASLRSILARRFGPRRAAVSAGSARCASIPARCNSSTTYRHPVQPSNAEATSHRSANRPNH